MEHFKVIGIAIETTNQNNQAATDLSLLWERFLNEGISSQIPNRLSNDIYAIYTDYESDYNGSYTAIIGHSVSTLSEIPEGFVGRVIVNEKLIRFTAKGEIPGAVVATWQEIWRNDIALYRTYQADFEVYGRQSQMGADAEVEIYIGVRR
ncbi:GyrI-like domain-containing protein [Pedobacter sandarakinus]|uniref:GyrI-like domain-containing protein n=1 Tax=Pedobacter sandarakinus TaxID=353156 RepID=UPI0022454223|nr:effector binding domain-containing protein [Pedobacter sandarakinus]MCX2573356.1 effector binding domain-containing protein [Pedobacter sandarakinus]